MTTSREIKKALNKAFKGVKFSVTTSDVLCKTITICWVGLPCINEVKEIADQWNTFQNHSDISTDYFHYTGTKIEYERELSEDEIDTLKTELPKYYKANIGGRDLKWCNREKLFAHVDDNGEYDWRSNVRFRSLSINEAIIQFINTGCFLPKDELITEEATPEPSNVVSEKTEQTPQEIAEWAKEEYKKATGDEKAVFYQMYLDAMDKIEHTPQEIPNPEPKIVIVPPQSETYKIVDGTAQLTPVNPEIRIYESEPLNREFLTVKTDHQDDLKTRYRYKQWVMAMVEQDKSEKIISFEDWKAIADFILV